MMINMSFQDQSTAWHGPTPEPLISRLPSPVEATPEGLRSTSVSLRRAQLNKDTLENMVRLAVRDELRRLGMDKSSVDQFREVIKREMAAVEGEVRTIRAEVQDIQSLVQGDELFDETEKMLDGVQKRLDSMLAGFHVELDKAAQNFRALIHVEDNEIQPPYQSPPSSPTDRVATPSPSSQSPSPPSPSPPPIVYGPEPKTLTSPSPPPSEDGSSEDGSSEDGSSESSSDDGK